MFKVTQKFSCESKCSVLSQYTAKKDAEDIQYITFLLMGRLYLTA